MDMDQLIAFQILAREAHFGRAATAMGISQPTVTFRIKSLEDELGITLFKRMGQMIKLTDEGEKLLSYVNRLTRIMQETKDQIHALKHSHAPKLSIVGTSNINTYLLPDILTQFQKHYPDWQLSVYTGTRKSIVEMVKDEICHIGLIRGPLVDPYLNYTPLLKEPIHLVVPKHHRFSDRSIIALQEIENEPIISYRFEPMMRAIFEQYSIATDIKPNIIMELENVITVKKMLLSGAGIAFLNESAIKEELIDGSLIALQIEGQFVQREIGICSMKYRLSIHAETFWQFILQRMNGNEKELG